ncbi:hypothetical protein [Actinomycetospora chibensis]|uniref:Uncharacterized protein n=1 Tax=Actinomycetospora chibensis TaxID=663606 RepID=A0ABV9RFV4_9PSEU|nr:hypothetical protein [Actinomycetospora chibensis]MDD7925030.1 hypothetical protein [Actinomycetospora chibensis]
MTQTENVAVDILLEPAASVSIYLQALLSAGRRYEVGVLQQRHRRASEDARSALEHAGVWSSATQVGALAPYRYDDQPAEIDVVEHGPGEAKREPGLHAHLVVRLLDGTHLDRPALERSLPFVRGRYERSLTDGLVSDLGLAVRELDGTLQLAGIPDDPFASFAPTACRVQVGVRQVR